MASTMAFCIFTLICINQKKLYALLIRYSKSRKYFAFIHSFIQKLFARTSSITGTINNIEDHSINEINCHLPQT